jgi:lycopene cyclase domain-containing protein
MERNKIGSLNRLFKDGFTLLALPLAGAAVSLWLKTPYLASIFLFYGLPGAYITVASLQWWQAVKGATFAAIVALPLTTIMDFIGTSRDVWYVPQTIFPTRFLGVIPWEDFVWLFAATYTIVVFFQAYLDEGKREVINPKMWYFAAFASLLLVLFFSALAFGEEAILLAQDRYSYLWLGAFFVGLPSGLYLGLFPQTAKRSTPLIAYFFYVTFLFELTAALLRQWTFPRTYLLAPVIFLGHSIPYEEFVFVGVGGPMAAMMFYKLCDDDWE